MLLREELPQGAHGGEEDVRVRQYSDYVQFGDELFPQSVQVEGQKQALVVFSAKKLTQLADAPPSDFLAPLGAEEFLTCDQPEKPELTSQVAPVYPSDAKVKREEGTVVLYGLVRTDGTVHNLKVIEGTSALLAGAAPDAVSQWRYKPRKCRGIPTSDETFIDVSFKLEQ